MRPACSTEDFPGCTKKPCLKKTEARGWGEMKEKKEEQRNGRERKKERKSRTQKKRMERIGGTYLDRQLDRDLGAPLNLVKRIPLWLSVRSTLALCKGQKSCQGWKWSEVTKHSSPKGHCKIKAKEDRMKDMVPENASRCPGSQQQTRATTGGNSGGCRLEDISSSNSNW